MSKRTFNSGEVLFEKKEHNSDIYSSMGMRVKCQATVECRILKKKKKTLNFLNHFDMNYCKTY